MYAAAGLDYEAEIAADEDAEPDEDDEPECGEPDGTADLPTGPVLPADFRRGANAWAGHRNKVSLR